MGFAGSKNEAFTLAAVAFTINLVLLYGFMTKPVIEYHLSTDVDYNETIDLSIPVQFGNFVKEFGFGSVLVKPDQG